MPLRRQKSHLGDPTPASTMRVPSWTAEFYKAEFGECPTTARRIEVLSQIQLWARLRRDLPVHGPLPDVPRPDTRMYPAKTPRHIGPLAQPAAYFLATVGSRAHAQDTESMSGSPAHVQDEEYLTLWLAKMACHLLSHNSRKGISSESVHAFYMSGGNAGARPAGTDSGLLCMYSNHLKRNKNPTVAFTSEFMHAVLGLQPLSLQLRLPSCLWQNSASEMTNPFPLKIPTICT
ncbi:hypothetical protein PG989_000507 [Apiospora arundinis]